MVKTWVTSRWKNPRLTGHFSAEINNSTAIGTDPWGAVTRKYACAGLIRTWTPLDLGSKLLAWWSADRLDLLTLSGSQVTSWRDVVGAYELTQAVAGQRPLWAATGMGGDPGVTLDGVDDCLELMSTPASFPIGAAPCEMWAAVDQALPAGTSGARYIMTYGSTTNGWRGIYRTTPSGSNRGGVVAGDGTQQVTANVLTTTFSGRHVIRGVVGATEISASIDGGVAATAAVVPATQSGRVRIGAHSTNSTPSAFFVGVIRDAILTTSTLTTAEAAALQAYLTAHARM